MIAKADEEGQQCPKTRREGLLDYGIMCRKHEIRPHFFGR
jgi:hypothetical protein